MRSRDNEQLAARIEGQQHRVHDLQVESTRSAALRESLQGGIPRQRRDRMIHGPPAVIAHPDSELEQAAVPRPRVIHGTGAFVAMVAVVLRVHQKPSAGHRVMSRGGFREPHEDVVATARRPRCASSGSFRAIALHGLSSIVEQSDGGDDASSRRHRGEGSTVGPVGSAARRPGLG